MATFGQLSREIAAAVKARDCRRAQVLAGRLRLTAKTEREHHALYSLGRKVAKCQWAPLGGSVRRRRSLDSARRGRRPLGAHTTPLQDQLFEIVREGLMVRRGLVIDAALARERAGNIVQAIGFVIPLED